MGTLARERHDSSNVRGISTVQDVSQGSATKVEAEVEEDFVEFLLAGVRATGEFHCAECGYGVASYRELPVCPMCGNETWEQTAWSPFARALRLQ
jgi:rubrerythrin